MKIFDLNQHNLAAAELQNLPPDLFDANSSEIDTGKTFGEPLTIRAAIFCVPNLIGALHTPTQTLAAAAFIARPSASDHANGLECVSQLVTGRQENDLGALLRYLPTSEDDPVVFVATLACAPESHQRAGRDALIAYCWSTLCVSSRS